MAKVKTFASSLQIFHAKKELEKLDHLLNAFVEQHQIQKIIGERHLYNGQ